MASNIERLEEAGLLVNLPLPDAYAEVFESLSEQEVDTLVSVKQRLDKAEEDWQAPPYKTFVVPL